MIRVINARTMPKDGYYKISTLSLKDFIALLKNNDFTSYIYHQETIGVLTDITGLHITKNPLVEVKSGDIILSMSLPYDSKHRLGKRNPQVYRRAEDYVFSMAHYFASFEELQAFCKNNACVNKDG